MNPSYFLISVSNRKNLDLCEKYGLAGFMNSINGVWTFLEVCEEDYISFLYGARAHNLYKVVKREAIENARELPPWDVITFRESGRTYYFPFRLHLKLVREVDEPLVRAEFAYVAENLLLRGGYRRTHFQADQTTLQNVSHMGKPSNAATEPLAMPTYSLFTPSFARKRAQVLNPTVFPLSEIILQAAIRQHLLQDKNLSCLLGNLGIDTLPADAFEVLGEKALPEGHVDILLKERVPIGRAVQVPIEVKLGVARPIDVSQIRAYVDELGQECPAGILVASGFTREAIRQAGACGVQLVRYVLDLDWSVPRTFDEVKRALRLEVAEYRHP